MAINTISFQSNIYKSAKVSPMDRIDREEIQNYADKYDIDAHLLKENQYYDGAKKYTSAVIGNDGQAYIKVFNMKYPEYAV